MRSECLCRERQVIRRGGGGIRLYLGVNFNANIRWGSAIILTSNLAAVIASGAVDLFVLGLVCRFHVPVEAILQTKRVVLILYALELFRATAQCASSVDKM